MNIWLAIAITGCIAVALWIVVMYRFNKMMQKFNRDLHNIEERIMKGESL